MRVLVTGGAGLIGSHIVDQLLANGHEPAVLDDLSSGRRENLPDAVTLYQVDVRDGLAVETVFENFQPEAVCHQAAQMSVSRSVREPAFDAQVNVMGLLHILNGAVRSQAKRVVFASSGGVLYGDAYKPADENTPANPISPYGISKWVGERYLEFYAREHHLPAVALRYANVYGPRQNPHGEAGVVAVFCQKLLAGQPATINGDGKYIRDYVFVEDVAKANLLALTSELSEPFLPINIGTATGIDVNELEAALRPVCEEIRQSQGITKPLPPPKFQSARAGDLRSNLVNPARAKHSLGWEPKTPISEGLQKTAAWFADQG